MEVRYLEPGKVADLEFQRSLWELQNCWLAVKRHWLAATAVFSVIFGGAVLAASLQKPVYKAEGRLLFRLDRTASLTGVGGSLEKSDALAEVLEKPDALSSALDTKPIRTRMQIIGSVPIAQKVIDALQLKDEKGEMLTPRDFIKQRLDLKEVKSTDVLIVSYKGNSAQESATVVNKLMEAYLDHSVQTKRVRTMTASDFIRRQLPQTQLAVLKAEAAVRNFKERHRIISLDKEEESTAAAIANLDNQIVEVERNLAATRGEQSRLRQQVGSDSQTALNMTRLSQSSGVQTALRELHEVESKLAAKRSQFSDSFPEVASLADKRAALQRLLQQRVAQVTSSQPRVDQPPQIAQILQDMTKDFLNAEVKRTNYQNQLATLLKARTIHQQRAQILPRLEQELQELQRQAAAAQDTYQGLLKRLLEIRIAEHQAMADAQILEPAIPPNGPSIRQPAMLVALGFVLASLGAIATIVQFELRDNSLKTLRAVRERFNYPLLGVIPSFHKKSLRQLRGSEHKIPELLVQQWPGSIFSESYRMLQANLKFANSEQIRVITLTSAVPKEGKSTTAANLATAIAQLGHSVLLLDADLRHPMQHYIWGLNLTPGLTNILIGEVPLEAVGAAISTVMDNLDVLAAGTIPPNPAALLESERMTALMRVLAETYDFVILDSPPLVAAADALTLGRLADGLLLVSRPGVINAVGAKAAREALEQSNQQVLGLVVNGLLVDNEPDSYFHFAEEYYTATSLPAPTSPLLNVSGAAANQSSPRSR